MTLGLVAVSPNQRVATWQREYNLRLVLTDLLVVSAAVFGAQYWRFGAALKELSAYPTRTALFTVDYTVVSVALIAIWMGTLHLMDTRDYRIIGAGPEEYKRVLDATLMAFGIAAIVAYLLKFSIARGYLIMAGPAGLILLLLSRWLWRKWLSKKRREGEYLHRALVIGQQFKTQHVELNLNSNADAGYQVVGTHSLIGDQAVSDEWDPAEFGQILTAIDSSGIDTLVVAGSDLLTPRRLRELGWAMETRDVELVMAPTLTDVAGPRIHMRPVGGMPLLHVDSPTLTRRASFAKRLFDIVGSAILIVLGSPLLLAVALAVKLSSPGPILFKQERIGLNGEPFKMLKFRSMVVDADSQLTALLKAQGTEDKPLFKVKNDPRITPVGRFIRKYSLDELPQFFNVLGGSMSLVGPRPQVAAEVALYDDGAARRLLTRPGITGLWQISGRSDLDWEDAIRLDLYYVENWSLMEDLMILYRTIRTVISPEGAY